MELDTGEFYVGQKVVCVNDVEGEFRIPGVKYHRGLDGLTKGTVYTIRDICTHPDGRKDFIKVKEIVRKVLDCPYSHNRFKPLESKAISIFRKIAEDVSNGKVIQMKETKRELERVR